jgi:dihydroorotase
VGAVADVCVFDPEAWWKVEPAALKSQGKNTPFTGYEVQGKVRCTLVGGQVAYQG